MVPQSCCLLLIWAGLEESLLLCFSLEQDYYGEHGGTATVRLILLHPSWGSAGGPGRIPPGCVKHLQRLFSFQGDTRAVCTSKLGQFRLCVFIAGSGVTGDGDKGWLSSGEWAVVSHPLASPGTHTAWQECCQGTSKACRMARAASHAAVAGGPGHKANASTENWKLFRLGFLHLLKPSCSLGCSWFLMGVSTSNKFLVQ